MKTKRARLIRQAIVQARHDFTHPFRMPPILQFKTFFDARVFTLAYKATYRKLLESTLKS